MSSNYVNIVSEVEVIGNIFLNPSLLDSDKYFFIEDDFSSDFHRTIFGSIFNLHANGVTKIEIKDIENYLKDKKKSQAVFEYYKGRDFLKDIAEKISFSSFEYYYNRLKKFSLMRAFSREAGMDLKWLYDPDLLLDVKKQEAQDKWLDETPLGEISDLIVKKITEIELKVTFEEEAHVFPASYKIREYLKSLRESPAYGLSLFGAIRNGIHKGARRGCFFLRSGGEGTGKSRSMVGDAVFLGATEYYDEEKEEWVKTGKAQPVEYIMVEQSLNEVQMMMISFISGVDERRILYHSNELTKEEEERLEKGTIIFEQANIHINLLHEYNITDLKNNIKSAVSERGSIYIFFDYIENNVKIIEEMTQRAGGKVGLREDQILFMITNALKDLAVTLNVFIESGTQVNGEWKSSDHMDSTMLAGSKAMGRKIDYGEIMLKTSVADIEKISPILTSGYPTPNLKIGIYKNRGGIIDDHILWCKANKGVCKIRPVFLTDYNYQLVEIDEDLFVIEEDNGEDSIKATFLSPSRRDKNIDMTAFDEEEDIERKEQKAQEMIDKEEQNKGGGKEEVFDFDFDFRFGI